MSLYVVLEFRWCVILALGIPGNVLSAIVWLRRHVASKNSSAVYLAALAIDDLVLLLAYTYIVDSPCSRGIFGRYWLSECAAYLRRAAMNLEPLLVLGFSVERFTVILRPLQVCCIRLTLYKY